MHIDTPAGAASSPVTKPRSYALVAISQSLIALGALLAFSLVSEERPGRDTPALAGMALGIGALFGIVGWSTLGRTRPGGGWAVAGNTALLLGVMSMVGPGGREATQVFLAGVGIWGAGNAFGRRMAMVTRLAGGLAALLAVALIQMVGDRATFAKEIPMTLMGAVIVAAVGAAVQKRT